MLYKVVLKEPLYSFPVMSVKGVNFGHMSKLRLPSEAATASENWANFTNRVEIPSLDLMEHMQQGGDAQIIFLSFKSLHALLPPPQDNDEKDLRFVYFLNSETNPIEVSIQMMIRLTSDFPLSYLLFRRR